MNGFERMALQMHATTSFRLLTTQVDTVHLILRRPAIDGTRRAFERLWSHGGLNARERALAEGLETK